MVVSCSATTNFLNTSKSGFESSFYLVAKQNQFFQRDSFTRAHLGSNISDRCIREGLGSSFRQCSDSRIVADFVQEQAYQLVRTESCVSSSPGVCKSVGEQECTCEVGQCYSCQLLKQTRWDKVPRTVLLDMASVPMVHNTLYTTESSTHSRKEECNSGCSVEGKTFSEIDRMDIEFNGRESSFQQNGTTVNRPLCNISEQETACFCFSISGRNCSGRSLNWTGMFAYAYPPPIILPKVLQKVLNENCTIILIAPVWPRQSWYPQILELMIDFPIRLPLIPDLLSQRGIFHPDPEIFSLVAWKVSNCRTKQKDFLKKVQQLWQMPESSQLSQFTMLDSEFLIVGVKNGISIPVRQLFLK